LVVLVADPPEPVVALADEEAPVLATLVAFPTAVASPVSPELPEEPLWVLPAVWAALPLIEPFVA
jgi:hypothetical protein